MATLESARMPSLRDKQLAKEAAKTAALAKEVAEVEAEQIEKVEIKKTANKLKGNK